VAALQALDVIAIPICRHVSFRLCIIKGRENPEKAARSRSAKFSCSCVHHKLSCVWPIFTGIEPMVDRQKSRRLIGKRADG
jgi:hypothetical protein